jgi:hypothetical protein
MFQDRDQMRMFYSQVFLKHLNRNPLEPMEQMLLNVILLHPEYHDLLKEPSTAAQQEYGIEHGQTNPYLHMGMHIAIREQASIDRPAGIAALHARLVSKLGESDAEHLMMDCLGTMLWTSQRENQPPDEQAYLECIRKLL